ncbi:MAG TPA: 2,3-bisphosphoglycerate-independent phosphoglycerate mutase [Chitinophagales bacterium]
MKTKKTALIILDGWGLGENPNADAIKQAETPFFDELMKSYPHSTLKTFGENVGLPFGQMGNSEVGHLNIGAGRIVYQELLKINNAIESGELQQREELKKLFDYCVTNNKPLHLLGLVSDGGIHAHISHLIAVCKYANEAGVKEIFIHAFTDGRDTDPKSGFNYIQQLITDVEKPFGTKVVSACGRYYAMDRDKRWERIKKAYDLLIKGEGKSTNNLAEAIKESYAENVTDEFILPIKTNEFRPIQENDAVFCVNFRTDRCREITTVLTQKNFEEFGMKTLPLYYVTMTIYDETFHGVKTIFDNAQLKNTLGEVVAHHGKTQLRAAETEKYPHVTFFFNGGRENPFAGEHRIMAPSPKVATYDLQPEMSAPELTERVVAFIKSDKPDFVCLNYANTDMVGHTGVFEAAKKAAKTVDNCLQEIVEICLENDYNILVTADHGNADFMINADGSPNTAHTKNLVPLIWVKNEKSGKLKSGVLADLAPTVLHLMNIPQPEEMGGKNLAI